jgi:catechol 2,3-dioxygenase-like lactoylglutathione lyase family enzyme
MFSKHLKTIHTSLTAKDPTRLAKWYQDVLGIKIGVELIKRGRLPVYFLKTKNGCEIEIHPFVKPHIGLVVDDFEAATKELASKGITLENVKTTSGGWKIGFFKDPEGNILELEHRPKGTPQV